MKNQAKQGRRPDLSKGWDASGLNVAADPFVKFAADKWTGETGQPLPHGAKEMLRQALYMAIDPDHELPKQWQVAKPGRGGYKLENPTIEQIQAIQKDLEAWSVERWRRERFRFYAFAVYQASLFVQKKAAVCRFVLLMRPIPPALLWLAEDVGGAVNGFADPLDVEFAITSKTETFLQHRLDEAQEVNPDCTIEDMRNAWKALPSDPVVRKILKK